MQRQIDLLNEHYTVTLYNHSKEKQMQVGNGEPLNAGLSMEQEGDYLVRLGNQKARIRMAVKGETAYIRAFGRTFTLHVMDPVEQAAQETGSGSNIARAPMPGTVVAVEISEGDHVTKGTPMMTIESMKILTIIAAPRDGEISKIHFEPGETFDKNAVLITLKEQEET